MLFRSEQWLARGKFRRGSAAERALGVLTETPIISASMLQQRLNVSAPAAAKAVTQLQAAGVVRERTGYKRNRVFAAEDVIAILGRPFGDEPTVA